MKHAPLTQASLRKYQQTLLDCTVAARRLLDLASPSINATDGTITSKQYQDVLDDALRTLDQVGALVQALEKKR
jgi:hypothetical protein